MIDWKQYASGVATTGPIRAPKCPPPMGRIYNGFLTLTLPDGGHRTFQIKTGYDGTRWAGKRTFGLLVGPSNTTDYDIIATLDLDGFKMLKRVMGTGDAPAKLPQWLDVIWRMAGGEKAEGYDVLEARHCIRCNRLLTTETSILSGIGEICEGKIE